MWVMLLSFQKYVPLTLVRGLARKKQVAELGVRKRYCVVMFCDIESTDFDSDCMA
jgi:hypothetical protein